MLANHFGDRAGLVPDRRDEGCHIVDAANEDRPDQNPQQRGQPAEQIAGNDWTDDRASGRNGRKMLAEEQIRFGRDKIDIVPQRGRWDRPRIVQLQPAGQNRSVREIRRADTSRRNQHHDQQRHRARLHSKQKVRRWPATKRPSRSTTALSCGTIVAVSMPPRFRQRWGGSGEPEASAPGGRSTPALTQTPETINRDCPA